jgi:pyruvate,water dikinase
MDHMPSGLFIRLPAVLEFPSSEVGSVARSRSRWYLNQIPVLPLVVLPKSSLKIIVESSKLVSKLEKLLQHLNVKDRSAIETTKKAVRKTFQDIKVPQNIKTAFLTEYYHYLGGGFVNIGVSDDRHSVIRHSNVTGDASVFASLLTVWAENFLYLYEYSPRSVLLSQILIEQPLIIEKIVQAKAAGIAYTLNPANLDKNIIPIYSTWGNFESAQNQPLDSFLVDLRTFAIAQTTISPKPTHLKLVADKFLATNTPSRMQLTPSLDVEQLRHLTQLILKVKQQSIDHLEIHWLLENYQFYILDTKPLDLFEIPSKHQTQKTEKQKTMTKLMVATGNPDLAHQHLNNDTDGVGIFRSEFVVNKSGLHPSFIIKSKYCKVLETEYASAIAAYQAQLNGRPFLFRSLNMTSGELLRLKYGQQYEMQESNPYLGYRGGIRLLTNPEWLYFEIKVLEHALKKFRSPIGLILPFVRTSSELSQLLSRVHTTTLTSYAHFQLWFQVNTPANLLNIDSYPLSKLTGIIINTKSLHGLMVGIDPDDQEFIGRYPLGTESVGSALVESIKKAQRVAPNLQILVYLQDYQASLAQLAVSTGVSGLIVEPAVLDRAKADMVDAEQVPFRNRDLNSFSLSG